MELPDTLFEQKLPETIFVKVEEDGDSSFLIADEDIGDLLDRNEDVTIGVYELKKVVTGTLEPIIR